ncbi:hypothetical protein [Dyella sp.]|uniref:hypothetical protein n=1 Tax=Dyella sp. TaxID=1869338 RepID=UPI002B477F63|nr:hypothetical protein [Dyella sp.]HKT28654.1 hypothetical protein [Dyella sp.]
MRRASVGRAVRDAPSLLLRNDAIQPISFNATPWKDPPINKPDRSIIAAGHANLQRFSPALREMMPRFSEVTRGDEGKEVAAAYRVSW